MEETRYKCIDSDTDEVKISSKYFMRQVIISSGAWTAFTMLGLCHGAPTVLIPQMRREANSTDAVSVHMASWIASAMCYGAIPWVFIVPALTYLLGRKIPCFIVYSGSLVGFIVMYFSNSALMILCSELIFGILSASVMCLSVLMITEYTFPKYRGIFLAMKSASFCWAMWIANAIGTFFHWKNIPLLGIACSVYALLTVLVTPESPYWLASNRKFAECTKSHNWLKGTDKKSERELEELLESSKNYARIRTGSKIKQSKGCRSLEILGIFLTDKEVTRPLLLSFLIVFLYHSSGKFVCSVYAVDIIKKITNSESAAYTGMLILDGVTVVGMYIGSILTRFLKRRGLLITATSIGVIFLFILSLYLYLVNLGIFEENKYISLVLLTGFSLALSCGPILLSTSMCAELLPLKFRNMSVCIIALFANVVTGSYIKLSPYLFVTLNMHGTFLLYGIVTFIVTLLVYLYFPETKDKTLQEIQDCINGKSKSLDSRKIVL